MVPLCGIGLRVHCFSKIKRLYFRELFLVQVSCYKVSSAPSFLIVKEQIQKTQKEEACASWIDTIYLFIALRTLRASVSKTLGPIRQILQNTLSQTRFRGGVVAPLAFSQSTCGGSSAAQFTVSTAFCTPLFFFSVLVKLPLFAAFLDAPEIK